MKNFKGLILECRVLLLEAKETSMLPIFEETFLFGMGKPFASLNQEQKMSLERYKKDNMDKLKKKLEGFSQHECSWIIQEFINGSVYTPNRKNESARFIWSEDFGKVSSLVIAYNKLKKNPQAKKQLKNDLMKYDYNELLTDIQRLEEFNIDEGNNKILYDNDGWKIYELKHYEEAIKLIGNNQNSWCIKEEINFNKSYDKPFYVFYQDGKPYACGNIQIKQNEMNLKDVDDQEFKRLDGAFEKPISWLLLDYLKDQILQTPFKHIADLRFLLKHDSKHYSKLFDREVIKDHCKNVDNVKLYYSVLSSDEHDNTKEGKIHQAIVNSEDVSIEDLKWIHSIEGIVSYDRHFTFDCFSLAVRVGNAKVVKVLFDLETKDASHRSHRHMRGNDFIAAIRRGYIEVVDLFLKNGYSVDQEFNGCGISEHYPLFIACVAGEVKMVQFLIDKGAELNYVYFEQTALRVACTHYHSDVVKVLMKNGIKLKDDSMFEIVLETIQNNWAINKACLIELLKGGYNLNIKKRGQTIFLRLLNGCSTIRIDTKTKAIAIMLKYGKDIDLEVRDNDGYTALAMACSLDSKGKDIVKMLIQSHADVNAKANNGDSPILFTCLGSENGDILKLLIDAGADVNECDFSENSVLDLCIRHKDYEMVELLLKNGADIHHKNGMGFPALEWARRTHNNASIIKLLEEYEKNRK